mmetsp:Transcript_12270/g.14511  ORF Transcript_12270/g.14511 Transcript_12270/m.14511 type:complete len:101 (-) Transcript_12270:1097-1399(-)
MASYVLRLHLQLHRLRLFLAHAVVEASLAIRAHRRHHQKVRLRRGQHPETVSADLYRSDRVSKTGQQGLSVLPELLVEPDFAVVAAKGKIARHRSTDSGE